MFRTLHWFRLLSASIFMALAMGLTPGEIEQTVATCSSVMGMPGTVAAFTWVRDVLDA